MTDAGGTQQPALPSSLRLAAQNYASCGWSSRFVSLNCVAGSMSFRTRARPVTSGVSELGAGLESPVSQREIW